MSIQTVNKISDELSQHLMEVENTQKICNALMKAPHYAKMGIEGVFAIVSKAKSLGMDPMEALNGGLYYVQGRVGMPAESMASLIRQKGHSITKDPKSNHEICILHGRRGDNGDTWMSSFSMEDARRAGLARNMYEKYPASMLYNRAMSFLARQLFPDIIRGAGYTYEELKEISSNSAPVLIGKTEELIQESLSDDQIEELKELFSACDPAYYEQVISALKKSNANIDSIEKIPAHLFERLKNSLEKKAKEYRASQSAIPEVEVVHG